MKRIAFSGVAILLVACAPLYVQPPLSGNSVVYFVKDVEAGVLSHEPSIQAYLDARDCSERMRVTPAEWVDMTTGKGIVLRADREFAVSLEAIRSIKLVGMDVVRNSCKAVVSFIPQANQRYRLKYVARQDGCALEVKRLVPDGSAVAEVPDTTARRRQWLDSVTGPACKAENDG